MSLVLSIELQKFRQHNGYYKYGDLAKIAKLFGVEVFVNPKDVLPTKHMAVFRRSHNQSFQVFINTGIESIEIFARYQ